MADELKFEAVMEYREALARLEDMLAGLREHHLELSEQGKSVILSPELVVNFKYKAKSQKKKEKLEIALSWRK